MGDKERERGQEVETGRACDSDTVAPTENETAQTQRRAWWLSTRRRSPEWQSLRAAGTATFSGRPRSHYRAARPGDPVLIYLSRPDHAIRAVALVTKGAEAFEEPPGARPNGDTALTAEKPPVVRDPRIEVQLAIELPGNLPWRALRDEPLLASAEPVRKRSSGSLFALAGSEYEAVRAMLEARNPELAPAFAAIDAGEPVPLPGPDGREPATLLPGRTLREEVAPYEVEPAAWDGAPLQPSLPAVASVGELEELTGLARSLLEDARSLLEDAGQLVLTGPPGTGKTWLARGLAALVAGDSARVAIAQFHPGTTYEDFVEGLKPRVDSMGRVTYAVLPGLFLRLCEAARSDSEHPYVLLIDEINRAPLSRVFGELLYALEYRGPEGAVALSLSSGMGEPRRFYVPENVFIIGTMNSADRSLAILDYALRRRFRFLELEPSVPVLDRWLTQHGVGAAHRRVVLDLFTEVNRRLGESLDADHRLGHTYFMLDPLTAGTLDRLWRTATKPLLQEYFVPPTGEIEEYAALFSEAEDEL